MLTLHVNSTELWNDEKQEFIILEGQTLKLEHSLVSISKWESKYLKPFISTKEKTLEEKNYYIQCMNMTQNVQSYLFSCLTQENYTTIDNYINSPMTATIITDTSKNNNKNNKEIITSELVYYWLVAFNIPLECQKWHFNRLLALINICNIKNNPPKNKSKKEVMSNNAALNAARRKKLNTKG